MKKSSHAFVLILVITCLGVASLAVATRWGIGASPDSVVYIGAARSIAAGQGYRYPAWTGPGEPVTHFPPLYSFILALGGAVGIDPLSGARLLNLLLYAANGLFFGSVLLAHGGKSGWLPALGTFLLLTSIPMLTIHSMAWSEPLFLLLGFLSLLLLAKHIQAKNTLLLVASALLAGLALLTRYAGIAIVTSGFISLVIFRTESFRKRLLNGLAYCGLGILPGLVWALRNQWVAGTATNREIIYHPISPSTLANGVKILASWAMVPDSLSTPLLGIVLLALLSGFLAIVFFLMRKTAYQHHLSLKGLLQRIPVYHVMLGVFILVYAGFLILSISFIDANTPMDHRILSPIFWGGALLFFSLFMPPVRVELGNFSRVIMIGLVLFSLGYSWLATKFVLNGFREGIGLNSLVWQRSETIAQVKRLPAETPVYSNAAEAVYLHTYHPALRIPREIELVTGQPNPEYESILQNIRSVITEQAGVLAYFDFFQPAGYPTRDELVELLSLRVGMMTADGTIFVAGDVQ